MQSLRTSITVSVSIPEINKPLLIYSKYINHLGGLKFGGPLGECGYSYCHLSLKTMVLARKLTQNCYVNKNISFS